MESTRYAPSYQAIPCAPPNDPYRHGVSGQCVRADADGAGAPHAPAPRTPPRRKTTEAEAPGYAHTTIRLISFCAPCASKGVRSPAVTWNGRRFSRRGTGQVQYGVKAHGKL